MSILVGQRFHDSALSEGARAQSCEKCQLSYLYRPRCEASENVTELVACPKCGWFQAKMVAAAKFSKSRKVLVVALVLSALTVLADLVIHHGGVTIHHLAAVALSLAAGAISYKLHDPNKGYTAGDGLPSRAEDSLGVLLDDFDGSDLHDEILEREVFRCLRASMISMAGIDGVIHPSEMLAISSIYQRITGERVDVGTLENETRVALGKTTEMLKSLHLLAPYIDCDSKVDFLMSVRAVALADGTVDKSESRLADQIAESLELSEQEVEYTRKRGTTL